MKTHKIIFAFFTMCTAIVIISACSTKDLELVNPTQLSPETFFRTEAQVQSSVNAAYVNLQTIGLFTRAYFFMFDLMGGDAGGNPQLEADKRQYLEFSFDANHGNMGDYWESCYRGINKANFVLGNAESINAAPISQAKKDKFFGEAKFLRALYNFLLVTRWGDIPLITDIPTTTDGIAKSPKAAVYDLIISDLQSASTTLLDKGVEANGRATKQAAIALLGKVYLYQEKYDLALAEFNKLNGQFSLEPDFYDNFMDETEHGVESIFEIEYDETLGANALWNSSVSGAGANESTLRGQEYGFNDWFNTYPANDLLAEYETGDTRFEDTFYVAGDFFGGTGGRAVLAADLTVPGAVRAAGWKKYQNYYKRLNENINSSINFKYIRYADVLLMMAECENKRPGGSQNAAIGYINQVRQRPSVMLPALPLGLAAPAVFDAIVHERRVELAGEQARFSDLVRWGLAATELAGQGYQSKHALWPIPRRELDSNDALTPEDQNPGY
ncbi:RagB/SusD family nutrient uptake outer membrane protein [Confluentibacter flavum]|nr:RagB/SusD family nutrient uptake outer membrane protein [Confluentibacter flavum]